MTLADLTRRFWRRTQPTTGRHRVPEVPVRRLDAAQITAAVTALQEEPTALARAVRRHLDGETHTLDRAALLHQLGQPVLVRPYVQAGWHHMQGWS